MLALIVVLVVYCFLLPNGPEPLTTKLLEIRSRVIYSFIGVYAYVALRDQLDVRRVCDWFLNLVTISAGVGIGQYLLRSSLPNSLLVSRDTTTFSYYGTDIIRTTGLVGNTIVYATLLAIGFATSLGCALWRPGRWARTRPVLVAAAMVTTYSRVGIAGLVAITVVEIIVFSLSRRRASTVVRVVCTAAVVAVLVTVALEFTPLGGVFSGSFIYRGLFLDHNASVQASDQIHAGFLSQALEIVHSHWAIGAGLATEAETAQNTQFQQAITDGSGLATLAECGLVGLVAYGALIGATVRALWARAGVDSPGRGLAVGLLVYTVYQFGFASFVDSGYFGKAPFVVYWLLVGTVLSTAAVTPSDPEPGRCVTPSAPATRAGRH